MKYPRRECLGLRTKGRSTIAFTLIELLVVVAIIAILAAMLLPALARAQMQAWKIQCVSNQKQIVLAWSLYSPDNREILVQNGGENTSLSPPYLWAHGGNHGDPQTLTNTEYLVGPQYSLFANYVRAVGIYKCAADRSLWPLGNKMVYELRSYALNSYVGTGPLTLQVPLVLNSSYRVYLKASSLAADEPAKRMAFIDVNPASICTPGYGVDMTADTWIHYPSSFHNRGGVLSYADSHVEAHKWTDPRTARTLPGAAQYIPHGESSPNNADLKWIRDRTTKLK